MLHENVAAMNQDNFVVRPHRQYVEKYAKAEAWQVLGPDDFDVLTRSRGPPDRARR
jgi:type I restriction enzyme R subunit